MKSLAVYGVGHALVDLQVSLSEESFSRLGLEKGSSVLVRDTSELLTQLGANEPTPSGGGSIANSIYMVSQLGGKAAFSGRTADDRFGKFFRDELDTLGLERNRNVIATGNTGTCLAIVTPDSERTMRTALGVSVDIGPEDIRRDLVTSSKWVFLEGYLLSNSARANEAIDILIDNAKRDGTKIAFSVSDASIAKRLTARVREVAKQSDLIFANEREGAALTGGRDADECFQKLKEITPNVVLTLGKHGSLIRYGHTECKVGASPCTPIDTTGAGDSFAGAFIYGVSHGHSAEDSARAASRIAAKVISQFGARLKEGAQDCWQGVSF